MGFYAGTNIWRDVIYQLETSDPVVGGTVSWRGDYPTSGYSNAPIQNLADRTTFLKGKVEELLVEVGKGILSEVEHENTDSIEIVGDGSRENPLRANIRSALDSIAWTRGNNTFTKNNLFRGLTEVEDPLTSRGAVNKRTLEAGLGSKADKTYVDEGFLEAKDHQKLNNRNEPNAHDASAISVNALQDYADVTNAQEMLSNLWARQYDAFIRIESTTIPKEVRLIRTNGYYVAGDRGGACYVRSDAEPTHKGKVQSLDGAWWELATNYPIPQMFGATADGIRDDLEAINQCGEYCNKKGIGLLFLPDGVYRIKESATGTAALPDVGYKGIVVYDGMTIKGQSRDRTIIKPVDGYARHCICPVRGEVSWSVEDLTIDGNKENNAQGTNGIRAHSENKLVRISNVLSKNNRGYGIGVAYEGSDPKINLHLYVSDCIVEHNDGDGFDCKISKFSSIERVIGRYNGVAGIDIRGHDVILSDCLAHDNADWGISAGRNTSMGDGIARSQVVNCISHGNGGVGFRLRDGAENSNEFIEFRLANCSSYRNSGSGVGIYCGRGNIVISGGTIFENGIHGVNIAEVVGVFPDPENLFVELNGTIIRDNENHSIVCQQGSSSRLNIIGGSIKNKENSYGINGPFKTIRAIGADFIGGQYGVVWGNTVTQPDGAEIVGCTFSGQSVYGFSGNTNSKGIISGCTFKSQNGFRTLSGAGKWLVSGNNFLDVQGTDVSDGSSTVTQVNNLI